MTSDRRRHTRFTLSGLSAEIVISKEDGRTLHVAGNIVDISYTGIKIKLHETVTADINDKIKIDLQLPESGIPIAISGKIVHRLSATECGIYFGDRHDESAVDELMFECVRLSV